MKIFPSLTLLVTILLLVGGSYLLPSLSSTWNTETIEAATDENQKKPETSRPKESSKSPRTAKLDPVQILRQAQEVLRSHRSFKAKIEQEFVIDGRKLHASGKYFQAPGFKLRMELTVRIGAGKNAVEGSLLQVCDGQVLWTRHEIAGKPRITRRDVRQIASVAESAGLSKNNFLVMKIGLGGLPAYLASLEKCFRFKKAKKETLKNKNRSEEVYVLDGEWSELYRKYFASIDPHAKGLPSHVPDRVRLVFDKELIPRRIIYAKLDPNSNELDRMVTLRFDSIEINTPIDENTFRFVPTDGVYQDDITNAYIIQIKAANKTKK